MKFLLNLALISMLFSYANQSFAQKMGNVFSYMVGDCEVILLSDGQGQGKVDILIGATASMLEECILDGTFSNAYNAFLIKTPEKKILVDAGTGAKLFENLASVNVSPLEIDAILLTHMHGDHTGGLLTNDEVMFPNAELYISQPEYNYWTNGKGRGFDQARAIIEAYKNKLKLFEAASFDGDVKQLASSVVAISAPGHTPGHTMYMISSDGNQMLIWGDLTHAMDIQMSYPQVAVTYDTHPKQAIESRQKTLEYISKNNIPIAGMHIAFPAMGRVGVPMKIEGAGAKYTFEIFK